MKILLPFFTAIVLCSCAGNGKAEKENDQQMNKADYVVEKNPVDTIILRKKIFKKQLNSNGKLKSIEKCDLKFMTSGKIETLNIRNGQQVSKGDILAKLDTKEAERSLVRAKMTKEKADLDMKDYLIGQGYKIDSLKFVPKETLRIAEIRSGHASAVSEIEQAEIVIDNSIIYAPFSGKIANLELKTNEYTTEKFCTLINDGQFDVDFAVLETEIDLVKVGNVVKVSPFNNKDVIVTGTVSEINPTIDDKGQIKIKAAIRNDDKLIDGMNVKIYIEESVPNLLVVPKSAVVIRDNLEVLFRMSPDGKAMWTYINILMANSDSYVVTPNVSRSAELNEGDIIIVSGNLNLADGSEVEFVKK